MSELDTMETTRPEAAPPPDAADPVGEPKEAPEPDRLESPTRPAPDAASEPEEPEAPEPVDDTDPEGSEEPLEPEAAAEHDEDADTCATDARADEEAEPEEPDSPEVEADAELPADPETPDEPAEPEASADGDGPDDPDEPASSEQPEEEPDESEGPEQLENSEESETDDAPDDPERDDVEEADDSDASAEAYDSDAPGAAGRPEAPDDEDVPELELELKPRREVPYAPVHAAPLSSGRPAEESKTVPEQPHTQAPDSAASDEADDGGTELQESDEPETAEDTADTATSKDVQGVKSEGPDAAVEPSETDEAYGDAVSDSGDDGNSAVAPVESTDQLLEAVSHLEERKLTTDSGEAFYGQEDSDMRDLAAKLEPEQGSFTVDLHGTSSSVEVDGRSINAEELGTFLASDKSDWGGGPIRLMSCETGQGEDSFAQQLSDKLGVPVTAPTELAWSDAEGNSWVASGVFDEYGDMQSTWPPDGEWVTFKPNSKS
ncbi:hypothetical protein [Streptomyces sp. NPDC059708]|uniref:hypothetical protein n=1 Tax=Streptomyces sp. NPDC059708 TaxID=3346916 RepID=UPI00369DF6A8